MSDRWQIRQLDVENFRGVRGLISLQLGPGMNVLGGGNGSGKTSVCHAIEWALFGKVATLTGDEFKEEDAIANRLARESKASSVRIALQCDGRTATIARTRSRGRSSTTGASVVTVEADGKRYERREAEAWIVESLRLEPNHFAAGVYLRQDTIAELVSGDEELRSAAIDRLLGLGQLRDLLENLQVVALDREIRALEAAETTQHESVTEAAAMRHVQLDRRRKELVSRGVPEPTLSEAGAGEMLSGVAHDLRKAGEGYGVEVPDVATEGARPADLTSVRSGLVACAQAVGAAAVREQIELENRSRRLQELQSTLKRVKAAAGDMENIDLDLLRSQLADLNARREAAAESSDALGRTLDSVGPLAGQLQSAIAAAEELRSRIAQVQADNPEAAREVLQSQIATARALLQQQSALARLLAAAKDQLSSHPSAECPVCSQPIEPAETLAHVERAIAASGDQSTALTRQLNDLENQLQAVETRLQALSQDESALLRAQEGIDQIVGRLRRSGLDIDRPDHESVRLMVDRLNTQHTEELVTAGDLARQHLELQRQIAGVEGVRAELEGVLNEISAILGVTEIPQDVEGAVSAAMESVERGQSVNQGRRLAVEAAETTLTKADDVLSYLRGLEEAERLDSDVLPVRRRLTQLRAARRRLTELRTAVLDVSNAVVLAQQQALSGNLADLMPAAQRRFKEMGGHPEYDTLVIEAESDSKTGTNIYRIRAASERGDNTFVRTVFSRAEMNVVALALFLTVADAGDQQLDITVLDDPSQSLDAGRKEVLAAILLAVAHQHQVIVATEDPSLLEQLARRDGGQAVNLIHAPGVGVSIQGQPLTAPQ